MCGDAEIDKWFRNKALKDHGTSKHIVTCATLEGSSDVIGFYALSAVVEDVRKLPEASVSFFSYGSELYFPCIQLVYLAVIKPLQGNLYGEVIMSYALREFAHIASSIGMPAMIVTPLNERAKKFYTKLGFEPYDRGMRMFLPLQSVLTGIDEVTAEDGGDEEPQQAPLA
ncbi:hypothetical protein LQ953_13325 [Sphingomonas sp. IC-56]|uniref:GNAT family N-acetyltransferase n=1 Tax=Sphingomonas sp. IC-56 TaxID=2898529 RepID=UPI001E5EAD43|nr:GNAT family N-acetyltransferase [Sphingomonas sp. IC-56]MCD2324999.1 hypothetical protein [Sphingomonas sp. IC-56]